MKKLDFIGIGLPKSGSTWIADNLRKHSQIFIPEEKELHYFNNFEHFIWNRKNPNRSKSIEWYHSHFQKSLSGQINGEFSVYYFESKNCPQDIFNYNPDVKLILTLRNPIDKAISLFQFGKQLGVYSPKATFGEALESDPYLIESSKYSESLKGYLKYFKKEQIFIVLFKDIVHNPEKLLIQLQEFLGVRQEHIEGIRNKSNATKSIKYTGLSAIISSFRKFILKNNLQSIIPFFRKIGLVKLLWWFQKRFSFTRAKQEIVLSQEERSKLTREFEPDIKKLSSLTGKSLSHWMT